MGWEMDSTLASVPKRWLMSGSKASPGEDGEPGVLGSRIEGYVSIYGNKCGTRWIPSEVYLISCSVTLQVLGVYREYIGSISIDKQDEVGFSYQGWDSHYNHRGLQIVADAWPIPLISDYYHMDICAIIRHRGLQIVADELRPAADRGHTGVRTAGARILRRAWSTLSRRELW